MAKGRNSRDSLTFRKRFTSEDALQQIVAGLLTRMPDVSNVQILQGTQEYGKDLIFSIRGAFGEGILCAAVIKNTKITGSVSSSKGTRTVFFQCEQAFDTPHLDARGQEIQIERAYIITPFDLAPETIRSITGKVKQRSGQVQFISGAKLFDLFKVYWPAVLADEFAAVASYLSSAKAELSQDNTLGHLVFQYQLGSADKNLRGVYVPPSLSHEIRSFRISSVLTQSVPPDSSFLTHITRTQLDEIRGRVRRAKTSIEALQQWGYIPPDNGRTVIDNIESFGSYVNDQWTAGSSRALERLLERTRRDKKPVDNAAPPNNVLMSENRLDTSERDALDHAERRLQQRGIRLPGRHEVTQRAQLLRAEIESVIAPIKARLEAIDRFVRSGPHGAAAVFTPEFMECARADDFVRRAPAGIFVASTEKPKPNQTNEEQQGPAPTVTSSIECSSELLSEWHGTILILGPAGYGKTSFCRWHALRDAELFSTGQSTILPVYIALHKLKSDRITSFRELAKNIVGRSALIGDDRGQPTNLDEQQIRVYLDGLDEIPDPEHRRTILRSSQEATECEPNVQLILTSRAYVYDDNPISLPTLRITELNDEQTKQLVLGWLSDRPSEVKTFHNQLHTSGTLIPLMRVPLLATLVMLVFRQTRRLPENRTRLYEMFVDLLSGGWDLAKGTQRGSAFGSVVKLMVLKRIAAKTHMAGKRQFGPTDLKYTIRTTLSQPFVDKWDGLERELLQDGLITRIGNTYEFSHLSFQEFFTASDLLGDPASRRADLILEKFLRGEEWWKEVLCFYAGLAGKPDEMLEWLSAARSLSSLTDKQIARCDDLMQSIATGFPVFVEQ